MAKSKRKPIIPEFYRKHLQVNEQYYILVHAYSTDEFWEIELWDDLSNKCLLILRHKIENHGDEEVSTIANEYRNNELVLSVMKKENKQ